MRNPILLLAPTDRASATVGTDTVRALGRTFGMGRPVLGSDAGALDVAARPAAASIRLDVLRLLRVAYGFVAGFYSRPLSWVLFVVSDGVLIYGGGAVMFWFHAIYLGELGPNIHPAAHWALDSTLGLIGLTPALFLILPIAAGASRWIGDRARWHAIRLETCAIVGGVLFAAATAPGPLVHDALVGRNTWLANQVERVIGTYSTAVHIHQQVGTPAFGAMAQQFGAGVPVYIVLMWISLHLARVIAARSVPGQRSLWRLADQHGLGPGD